MPADRSGPTGVEIGAMRRAIALSVFGVGTTSPNPPVGCVILDAAGRIVGEGYHERKGEPHAEAYALAAAGPRARGGTALVTLEPCNHQGRTPPCRQALIDAGVVRVVIAVLDPTSRGEGGAALLRSAGLSVEVGLLEDEALLVLGPWLTALRRARPNVTWAYQLGPGLTAFASEVAVASGVRQGFDVVLFEDGSIEEGAADSHGEGAFELPDLAGVASPDSLLAALFAGGTRSLLLDGGLSLAEPFLTAGRVDAVQVFVSAELGDGRPKGWPLVPPSFELARVQPLVGGVLVEATRRGEAVD